MKIGNLKELDYAHNLLEFQRNLSSGYRDIKKQLKQTKSKSVAGSDLKNVKSPDLLMKR
jgi:hypothetical protein